MQPSVAHVGINDHHSFLDSDNAERLVLTKDLPGLAPGAGLLTMMTLLASPVSVASGRVRKLRSD